jgi:hypothetical protein
MTRPRNLSSLLYRLALLAGAAIHPEPAAAAPLPDDNGAAPPPPQWQLITSVSSTGTFLLESTGGCSHETPAGALRPSAGGEPIVPAVHPTGSPCVFAYVPPAPLPPGEYCLSIEDPWSGLAREACFTVTGVIPQLPFTELSASLHAGVSADESCGTCGASAYPTCTRTRYLYSVEVDIGGVAREVASTHLFAWSLAQGDDESVATPLLDEPTWSALSPWFRLSVPIADWSAAFACLDLHARPIAGGESSFVARACIARPRRFVFPNSFYPEGAACDATYAARWCAQNLADCTELPALAVLPCESYDEHCNADGSAKLLPDAGAPFADPLDAGDAGSDGATAGEPVPPREANARGRDMSCSAASLPSRGWLWLVFLALAGWSALRTRRAPP